MSTHALFSPSAAHRWIACPGSFAYPGNTEDSESSIYADDGTASHTWAAMCLQSGQDADYFIGTETTINGAVYKMDEERAGFVQMYLDLVRERSIGKLLFVEQWVDLRELGDEEGGTVDAGVIDQEFVETIDLKYGMGEKIDASYIDAKGIRRPNQQLGLYACGLIRDAYLLGYNPNKVRLTVCQPRLNHIDSQEFTIEEIDKLLQAAIVASGKASRALVGTPAEALTLGFMNPGEKQCRWCRAKSDCPALAKFVADEVRADFETIAAGAAPSVPTAFVPASLSKAMQAIPLIMQWCAAVQEAVIAEVEQGHDVIGSDGKPMKFVEGRSGSRKWANEQEAEAALLGQLPPDKVYQPQKIITAPAAAKLLDKKRTKEVWKDVFAPLIARGAAQRVLALGSDERPPYTTSAEAGEFDDVAAE